MTNHCHSQEDHSGTSFQRFRQNLGDVGSLFLAQLFPHHRVRLCLRAPRYSNQASPPMTVMASIKADQIILLAADAHFFPVRQDLDTLLFFNTGAQRSAVFIVGLIN